ncbi:protein of unknown function [Candidatus Bipolaricaulis anaerobius]|uniref:Uncharacterized protein n=1 Tax=Candidatus Bipolaricaulis anaerobius TaxID=2026885 RepID=A0A2X3MMH2_9BACT|nr:protein of unknown function [Candidatus Bipolaricaulis anaerobius]
MKEHAAEVRDASCAVYARDINSPWFNRYSQQREHGGQDTWTYRVTHVENPQPSHLSPVRTHDDRRGGDRSMPCTIWESRCGPGLWRWSQRGTGSPKSGRRMGG